MFLSALINIIKIISSCVERAKTPFFKNVGLFNARPWRVVDKAVCGLFFVAVLDAQADIK